MSDSINCRISTQDVLLDKHRWTAVELYDRLTFALTLNYRLHYRNIWGHHFRHVLWVYVRKLFGVPLYSLRILLALPLPFEPTGA